MLRKMLFTNMMILAFSLAYSQPTGILCDHISAVETSFCLEPFQESFQITINYTGPNPGVKSGIYINQTVKIEENKFIESITIPPFDQKKLLTYLWDTQTISIELTYSGKKLPRKYSVSGTYRIKMGGNKDCEYHDIPITLSFKKKK